VNGWWSEIEVEIREIVQVHPALTLKELAAQLRVSESATASILRVLRVDQLYSSSVLL
jgi:DNA-binding Lrp family transcriptional regulator